MYENSWEVVHFIDVVGGVSISKYFKMFLLSCVMLSVLLMFFFDPRSRFLPFSHVVT